MGEKITLSIQKRDIRGKKVKQLRKQGLVPGVVYGAGMEPTPIQAEAGEVLRVVNAAGTHSPVMLTGAKKRIAMIKDVEFDATKHGVVHHVSFHAVKADEPVAADVPVVIVGENESAAKRAGLIVLQSLDKLEVKALPMDLPEHLEVDITDLAEAGDRVTVKDIVVPQGVEIVEHDDGHAEAEDEEEKPTIFDLVIATVYEPSALQAANEAAAGEAESADGSNVPAENGSDTENTQAEETMPGGKQQAEPKQSNVDANK